jgi:quinone-modifying oxidoreductase subunit QmoA
VEAGKLTEGRADLVVLATGMVPNSDGAALPFGITVDEDGFVVDDLPNGVTVAGVLRRPQDVAASVRDATGAAGRAWMIAEGRR